MITTLIKILLEKQQLPYSTITAPGRTTSGQWLLRTVAMENLATLDLLVDAEGIVMAIYPASHKLNLERLNELMRRQLELLEEQTVDKLIQDCRHDDKPECEPQIIVDVNLSNQEHIHFLNPDGSGLIRIDASKVQLLTDNLLIGSAISDSQLSEAEEPIADADIPRLDIRTALHRLKNLPNMPGFAARVLQLRADPDATVAQLADVVSQDATLAAQVVRYANSAFFGQAGNIKTIEDAVFRVLGFDGVVNLALGLSLVKGFTLPEAGPLGRTRFWRHSTYSAALAQKLTALTSPQLGLKAGTAYLAGLLHDIGFLVLSQLFRSEYFWLNKLADSRPEVSIRKLENQLLGTDHTELGAILLQSWKLPEELIAVATYHHDVNYDDSHAGYVLLVVLVDHVLKAHGLSDADSEDIPPFLLQRLGLEEDVVLTATDEVLQQDQALREMVASLCG